MIECSDKTLYTGITKNIEKRIKNHNLGKGAKYTKNRLPVKLLYFKKYPDKSSVSKEEYRIKKLSRDEKLRFISK